MASGATVVRGAAGSLAVRVAGAILALLVQIMLGRLLGVSGYGYYSLAVVVSSYLALPIRLGLDLSILRTIPGYLARGDLASLKGFVAFSFGLLLAGGVLVGGVYWLSLDLGAERIAPEMLDALWWAAPLGFATALVLVAEAHLRAAGSYIVGYVPNLVGRPILLGMAVVAAVSVGAVLRPMDVLLVATVTTFLAGAAAAAMLAFRLRKLLSGIPIQFQRTDWLKAASALFWISLLNVVLGQSDQLLVGTMLSASDIGIYSAASRLATLVAFGLTATNAFVAPQISLLYRQERLDELRQLVTHAARAVFVFTLLAVAALAIVGRGLLGLFGPQFSSGYPALMILLAGQVFNAWAGPVAMLLTMTDRHALVTRVLAFSAAVGIGLVALGTAVAGIEGAAVAKSATTLLWNGLLAVYAWKLLRIRGTAI